MGLIISCVCSSYPIEQQICREADYEAGRSATCSTSIVLSSNDESDSDQVASPLRASRASPSFSLNYKSPSQLRLPDEMFSNIACITFRNCKNKAFVPSTKNYILDMQFKKCLTDTGSTTVLLAISALASLRHLRHHFGNKAHTWELTSSRGVSTTYALKISFFNNPGGFFDLRVCSDILGGNTASKLPFLRFYLSSSSIAEILESKDLCDLLSNKTDVESLKIVQASGVFLPERDFSVLGQSFLSNYDSVGCQRATFFFIPGTFPIHQGWDLVQEMSIIIGMTAAEISLPEDYDDWVDGEDIFLDDIVRGKKIEYYD